MINRKLTLATMGFAAAAVLGSVTAQTDPAPSSGGNARAARVRPATATTVPTGSGANFGDPLPNLTAAQFADFADGLEDFQQADTAASGLGPIFNNVSCVACHSVPAVGGGSPTLETRFGRFAFGHFDPLASEGGSLLQISAIDPRAQEVIPPDANVIAKRITTPLFGLGLIEAIPDSAIIQNAHEPKPDNISGRISIVTDVASGSTRVGRFGWKAQQATLLAFAGDAYLNEIGITSRLFPTENAPNGNTQLLAKFDTVADPEDQVDPATGKADIDHFADFMRLLAPPPKLALSPAAKAGQDVFSQLGCTGCHEPTFVTGPNAIKALDRKVVALYSDLLLHDMGSLGDGIAQGTARTSEMKTPPLWGLRARGPYLHDGRAATISAAIRMHDGKAARARDRFNRLGSTQQQQLIAFLNAI
jgi:CxxC motif-containing protein (DUF1111 family)